MSGLTMKHIEAMDDADRWNAEHPVGTAVKFTNANGYPWTARAKTASPAFAMKYGALVRLEGHVMAALLAHLEVEP